MRDEEAVKEGGVREREKVGCEEGRPHLTSLG